MIGNGARFATAILLTLGGLIDLADGATATHRVRMYYNIGTVDIDLYGNESPLHVANFLEYVNAGDYDNTYIHRTNCCGGVYTFVQGGEYYVPEPGEFLDTNFVTGRGPVVNEFDPNNGLSNTPGTLAAARTSNPDSAENGWFINATDNAVAFDPGPYTVYGQVTDGLDVIQFIPTLPKVASLQGTNFATLPVYDNWFVYLYQVVELSLIDGDFDNDGMVEADDLDMWEDYYGELDIDGPDFNGDFNMDALDLAIWESNYGLYDGINTFAHFDYGDANRDSDVDAMDFLALQRSLGDTRDVSTDVNGDAVVTGLDFLGWQRNAGAGVPAAVSTIAAVPEPSSILLLTLGVLILNSRRR